jgi:hypothetical protein
MGYLFKKYEFDSQEQAEEKIAALPHETDEDGNDLWTTEPTYNEEGEIETEGVASDSYSVDVLWNGLDESPYGWKSKEISVKGNGVHTFAGWSFKS